MLEGTLHVQTFENGECVADHVRKPGDYNKKPPGDVHMEQSGPEGVLVLFQLFAPNGQLTRQLDSSGNVLSTLTTSALEKAIAKQPQYAAA